MRARSQPSCSHLSPAALEACAIALKAAVSDLHGQMAASSELIKAHADQNAQFIQGLESNRVRLLWCPCSEMP